MPNPEHNTTVAPAWTLHDRLTALTLLACIAWFVAEPDTDLRVSQWFYTPGAGFTWAQHPVVLWMYDWTPWIGRALVVVLAGIALRGRLNPAAVRPATRRMAVVALSAALLGPGLIVEVGLKPYWQRPRPVQVQSFGGDQPYRAPFRYCAPCTSHHSFVSSHAANGYFLLALGLTAPPARRRRWFAAGLVAGSVIGLGRMAQGGHFLSDVVFAFFVVWLSGQLVLTWRQRAHRGRSPTA
ncbi:phosphatase PAP2 family protein [Aquabacterium sp.]|uniref:phosphatase PAP2 family protein n=1 Tax=Aquabacterium sp. TaxID=1872578 RepID=UPI0035B388EB